MYLYIYECGYTIRVLLPPRYKLGSLNIVILFICLAPPMQHQQVPDGQLILYIFISYFSGTYYF